MDDRFFLMKIIGSGCFGTIYTAYNKASLENVAIKRAFKEDADNGRAAHTQYGLQHENILKLFEFIVSEYETFLVLEFCPDGTFNDKNLTGQLNEETSKAYFMQLCNGVRYLHEEQRLVHCDFQPDNILLIQETIKLAGFGLSCPIDAKSNTECGTKKISAPEVFIDDLESTEKVDVWAMDVSNLQQWALENDVENLVHSNRF